MRILILTFGSRGDVQPFVALGAALKALGHEVTVTTGQGFDAMITAAGLDTMPLSVDIRAMIEAPEIQAALRSFSGKIRAWRASKDMMRQQADETWEVAHAVRPELIVYSPKGALAPYLAETLNAIAVPAFLQPAFAPTGDFPNPLFPIGSLGRPGNRLSHRLLLRMMRWGHAASLRDWRRHRPDRAPTAVRDPLGGHYPRAGSAIRLHAHSVHLVPRPIDWPDHEHVTGYWFTDPDPDWQPPETLARFLEGGPPPVYVGFGSMPAQDAGQMTRLVIEALALAGRRGILAKGWGGLAEIDLPDTVHLIESAPHGRLFPLCSAVVHHGGAGTTHEALRWGRPSIVCPVFGDQPFWGRRVAALGAGPAPLPQKRLTAADLAAALTAAQAAPVVARAEELGAAIRREAGTETAARLIGGLAEEGCG